MKINFAVMGFLAALALSGAAAQGFKFSQPDETERAKEDARQDAIDAWLSTPCRAQLKNQKILLLIAEQSGNRFSANQQNYGPHFEAINRRLRALGLRTTTPEQLRQQIAQAEIEAYFKGDPDAALAASRKHGARFVLKGVIAAQAGVNRMIPVNEVTVDMSFFLSDTSGRPISQASAQGGSYAGADTRTIAAQLISEQADEVVARLYSEYCRNASVVSGAARGSTGKTQH
ncbi:MAG TPA: hypothetical protein VFP36_04170 [Usitatibacter sp.]|nr:hypothetical protein [Usitatibacter sp.]